MHRELACSARRRRQAFFGVPFFSIHKGGRRVKNGGKSDWFAAMQNLMWLTQLGLSIALPPIFCLWGAGWLARRFGVGEWVYFVAIVLGVGASACTFIKFAQMLNHRNHKK